MYKTKPITKEPPSSAPPTLQRKIENRVMETKEGGDIFLYIKITSSVVRRRHKQERKDLDFLYEEWAHPFFISINAYKELMQNTKRLDNAHPVEN